MVTIRTHLGFSTLTRFVALATAACLLWNATATVPAFADPADSGEGEGTIAQLRATLEQASLGYLGAKAALEQSQRHQLELTAELATVELQVTQLSATAGEIAVAAYRDRGLRTISTLVDSGSPDAFLDRVATMISVANANERKLRTLAAARQRLAENQVTAKGEIANGQRQLGAMASAKQAAEHALASQGGGQPSNGPGGTNSWSASPAPNRTNGSWPRESCSVNDPTTTGCITPRTLHAMLEAQAAGFARTVSCFRPGGSGEHPKGRACDFGSAPQGFGDAAAGADRIYGNNLAAFFVNNAGALAVLYVIWFEEVWLPSSGWRSYSGCLGDPSSDHTNHVHVSIA